MRRFFLRTRRRGVVSGGLTMSLDGGLEELAEFFSNFASRASNSTIARRASASRAVSPAQFAHRVVVEMNPIATPTYPIATESTKISLKTVNGYGRKSWR